MAASLDQHPCLYSESGALRRPLQRYAASGHRLVEGWLSEIAIWLLLDLAETQRVAGITGAVCEIGVHHGRLFILLHHLTEGRERSVCWDVFENQDQNVDGSGRGDRARLMKNLQWHEADLSRIAVHTANSLDLTPAAVAEACGGPPRIFSVDGGHTAEIAESDLRLAAESICDYGIIVLDDFFNEPFPGVAEGACRYMAAPTVPLFPVAISANKFILTKRREMAELYREQLSMPSPPLRRWETTVFGQPVVVFTIPLPWPTPALHTRAIRAIRRNPLWRGLRRTIRSVKPV